MLTFEDAMSLLSGVRLAAGLQLVQGLSVYTLNKLLIFSQPAHLAWAEGHELTDAEADVARIYEKAISLGATCEGKPGPRGAFGEFAYFRDLDGNKLCAFTMGGN